MSRRDPAPFAPKPYAPGSTVEIDGRTFAVQAPGKLPASVWAIEEPAGTWALLKNPTPSRAGYIIEDSLDHLGRPTGKEAA